MKGVSLRRILITAGVGTGIFLLLMLTRGGFAEPDPAARWMIICDALFVPAALLLSFGLLLFAAGGGVFDMMKFAVTKAYSVILPRKKRELLPKTFFDYKMEREAKERAKTGHLLIVGAVFLALAVLVLIMYNQFDPVL